MNINHIRDEQLAYPTVRTRAYQASLFTTLPDSRLQILKSSCVVLPDTPVEIAAHKIRLYGFANVRTYSPGTSWKLLYTAVDYLRAESADRVIKEYDKFMFQFKLEKPESTVVNDSTPSDVRK